MKSMHPFFLYKYPVILLFICSIFGLSQPVLGQNVSEPVRLNQIGFYPNAQKIAVVITEKQTTFELKDASTGKTVFKGKLSEPRTSQHSGKISRIADFSGVRKAGKYFIEVQSLGKSAAFEIKEKVYKEVAASSLKGFYYQRASIDLPEKFAVNPLLEIIGCHFTYGAKMTGACNTDQRVELSRLLIKCFDRFS